MKDRPEIKRRLWEQLERNDPFNGIREAVGAVNGAETKGEGVPYRHHFPRGW
jgi:hypothetical protein